MADQFPMKSQTMLHSMQSVATVLSSSLQYIGDVHRLVIE